MATMDDTKEQPYDPSSSGSDEKNLDPEVESAGPASMSPDSDTEKAAWQPTGKPPPDGGLTAWLVVLGVWCTSFCSFGWINSVGVFQAYYQTNMLSQYSSSTISWIPSLQIFFMMGLGPFVGVIFDHYGPRHLLFFGSLLHVFGIMMASLGTEYYQILLSQGVCSAIGAACIFQPSVNCAAGFFSKNRGAAFGIMFTGSSIGGVIFPIMVSRLIESVGFGWAMRICGFLILVLLVIANLTIKPFTPPKAYPVTVTQLRKPLGEMDFMLIMAGFFCFSWGFFPPLNYIEYEATSLGMSANLVQYLIPLLNAGSLFGRLGAGFLGDRIGRYNIYVIVCYFTGIFTLGLWIPDTSDAALIAFAVLYGFFSGAYVSLITPLVMAISPMPEIGLRTGIVLMACAFAGLTANPITGALVEGPSGFLGLKIWSGVFAMVGSTFVLVARIRRTGWKLTAVY